MVPELVGDPSHALPGRDRERRPRVPGRVKLERPDPGRERLELDAAPASGEVLLVDRATRLAREDERGNLGPRAGAASREVALGAGSRVAVALAEDLEQELREVRRHRNESSL